MMESVGALPAPDDTLSPKIIPLFGILSTVHDNPEEECHFCLDNIKNNDLFVTKTPCFRHNIHCKCFLKDGQNCPLLTTIRYDAPTAEQCIRTKNTASIPYENCDMMANDLNCDMMANSPTHHTKRLSDLIN
jgi:hypothetical protein